MYINDLAMRGMILRNLMIFLLLCFLFLFSATAGLGAEKLFVKSPKAPLWVEPSFQAEQILVLTKGQDVEKMEQRAGWLRVRIADQQGWMLKMMLSEEPPIQFSKEQQQAMENLALKARRRPSSFATTAAARGLKEKRKRFSSTLDTDYDALIKMEGWRVDEQSALDFLKKVK